MKKWRKSASVWLAGVLSCGIAANACAQWGGGQSDAGQIVGGILGGIGGALGGNQGWNNPGQQGGFGSGWITQTPRYKIDDGEIIRQEGWDTRVNWGNIISDVDRLGREAARQPRYPADSGYYPQYYPRYPQYSRPVQQLPRNQLPSNPLPGVSQPPLQNVVKTTTTRKAPPNQNVLEQCSDGLALNGTAETDARQAAEAENVNGMLDGSITASVDAAVAAGGNPQMREDWYNVIRAGGKPADIAQFQQKWGTALDPAARADLDLRLKFGEYSEALANGSLTPDGKDQALADLQAALDNRAAMPGANAQFFTTAGQHLANMQNFNNLGKLAEASAGLDNPFRPLIQGMQIAGLPPTFLGDMTGLPIMMQQPVRDSTAEQLAHGAVLSNPAENAQAVSYLLDNHSYTMRPGEQQTLKRSYTVAFDPGNGRGQKRYRLSDGAYQWRLDDEGWDLRSVSIKVTLDNSRYQGEFRYLVNNEQATLRPGQVAEHTGPLPIAIEFDRGDGGQPARKVLQSGHYVVGIDPDGPRLDLFPYEGETTALADAEAPTEGSSRPQHASGVKKTDRRQRVEELLRQLKSPGSADQVRSGQPSAPSIVEPGA